MNRLPRLQGAELKESNEQILRDYGKLAKYVVRRYIVAFRLSHEQSEDLLQSLLIEMFKAPASYRNYKGMSLMLKHKMRDVIKRTIRTEAEIPVGLMRPQAGEELSFPEPSVEESDLRSIEMGLIQKRLDVLPLSERTVMGLLYGLDGHQVFSDTLIAKKLSRNKWWVMRKHAKAIERLRECLRLVPGNLGSGEASGAELETMQ